ncbi:replication protein [Megasphaera elsdenii]|uniref:replication protein n=1 Tax=Megasphaera elsdenii TaxID=907 RepID=UPI00195E03F0|nr:replication protein [Megasphaera elsdenii]MBM6702879.1 replication protein [Megasphaera elsdenii]
MTTKAKKTSTKSKRTRNYATVVYPESAPEDWKEKLTELHVPCLISPLHDKDINPDQTPKKPHIHVMLMFDSVKTVEQVKELLQPIGAVGCEPISSVRGYARYLCHLDNPEKHQYSQLDVQELNGSDYIAVTELTSDRRATGQEIRKFCREYGIVSFSSLIEYADEYREDWIAYLEKSGWLIKEYLKSKAWSIEHGAEVDIKKMLDRQVKAADTDTNK